jgi:hypothetical protein
VKGPIKGGASDTSLTRSGPLGESPVTFDSRDLVTGPEGTSSTGFSFASLREADGDRLLAAFNFGAFGASAAEFSALELAHRFGDFFTAEHAFDAHKKMGLRVQSSARGRGNARRKLYRSFTLSVISADFGNPAR